MLITFLQEVMCLRIISGFIAGSPAPKLLQRHQSRTEKSCIKNVHKNSLSQNWHENKSNHPETEKQYSFIKNIALRKSDERTYSGSNC